jgi:hypothetical protein
MFSTRAAALFVSFIHVSFLVPLLSTLFLPGTDSNLVLFFVLIPSICSRESPGSKSCESAWASQLGGLFTHPFASVFSESQHMTSTDHFFVDAKVSLFGRRFNNANMLPLRGIKKKNYRVPICQKKLEVCCYGSGPCLIHVCQLRGGQSSLCRQPLLWWGHSPGQMGKWALGYTSGFVSFSLPARRRCVNVMKNKAPSAGGSHVTCSTGEGGNGFSPYPFWIPLLDI